MRPAQSRPLRVGLIGLGIIHDAHVRGYQSRPDLCRISAVCDSNQETLDRVASALAAEPFTDYHELVASDIVDAVDVILPHNLHYPVCRAALEHAKHTLVEKPMATSSQEARELLSLAADHELLFGVAENTRFVDAYRETERLLRSGIIGEPRLVRTLICGSEVARLSRPELWKGRKDGSGGGAIMDAGPHSFYLLEWLVGPIREIWSVADRTMEVAEVEDHALVVGQLEGGARFTCEFTFTAEIPWNERLELYCSEGSIIIDQLNDPPALLFRNRQSEGERIPDVEYAPFDWKRRSIARGAADFADAVANGRPPLVDPESGFRAIVAVEAAYGAGPPTPVVLAADRPSTTQGLCYP